MTSSDSAGTRPASRRRVRPIRVSLLAALLASQPLAMGAAALAQEVPAATPAPVSADSSPATHAPADPATDDRRPDDRAADAAALDQLTPAERHHLREILDSPAGREHADSHHAATVPGKAAATVPGKAAAAAPAAAAATAAKPKTVTLAPNSLAVEVLAQASSVQAVVVGQTRNFGHLFSDMALTGRWLQRELVDPQARAALFDALWRSTAVVLFALLTEHLLLLALRRPLRALGRDVHAADEEHAEQEIRERESEQSAARQLAAASATGPLATSAPGPLATSATGPLATTPAALSATAATPGLDADPTTTPPVVPAAPLVAESIDRVASQTETRSRDAAHRRRTLRLFRRLPFVLLRLLLKLIPLAAFLAIGNFAAASVAPSPRSQLVIITVTNLYGVGRVLWLLFDMLMAPKAPGVRLLRVGDDTARFLTRWWGWLVAIPVVAFCIADVGRILDLPDQASLAIQRAVVLVEHILLAVLIWQTRRPVAESLRPPRRLRSRSFGRLLVRLADNWWISALFFDAALWIVWAARIRGGYARMWQLFLTSCLIIFACRIVCVMLLGALDRIFRVEPDTAQQFPGLEQRAIRYYPALRRIITWALIIVCIVALMQAWGIPALAFFTRGTLGTHLLSALITILVTLAVGILIWELVNGALDRQINRFSATNQAPRAVRLQTLLPILRTLLFVVLGTILALTILSEIGVNIAPLLAGAGIIGVAVGFGSQKLVQDFITGIFLLVENAMQVGDSVTVAGISGTVEHLSIRTLRLRGGDGSIQIIPFSSVSTVANMSRDYAVATINVSIAFSEDTDRVCDLLNRIGAELRADPAFASQIIADFGLNGVDSLGEYAVAISGTLRCTVGGRWPVQREFNRRLRAAVAELGIALPQAHQSIVMPGLPALLDHEPRPASEPHHA